MERVSIEGRVRDQVGTGDSNRMRREGWIPANIYGHNEPNVHCLVNGRALTKAIMEEHHLLTIELGGRNENGLLKEIQWDALGSNIIHIDLARVSLDEVVETAIPVHTAGAAKGVSSGGVLDVLHHELPLKGKAGDLPEHVEIEVSHLGMNDSVKAGDIQLPAGIECMLDADEPVVIVHAPKADAEDVAEGGPSEPEVIGGKPDEDKAD